MAKFNDLHKKWALVGAAARLKAIQAESAEIYRVFPSLRRRRSQETDAASTKPRFSPEGRAAISDGMRRYWARRKALAAKTTKG